MIRQSKGTLSTHEIHIDFKKNTCEMRDRDDIDQPTKKLNDITHMALFSMPIAVIAGLIGMVFGSFISSCIAISTLAASTTILYLTRDASAPHLAKITAGMQRFYAGTTIAEFSKTKNREIEISPFSNTYLEFEATEEFGEKLARLDIIPEKNTIQMMLSIPKPRIAYWRAIFTFEDTPKSGKLIVRYT
jgi:hypothetical protein